MKFEYRQCKQPKCQQHCSTSECDPAAFNLACNLLALFTACTVIIRRRHKITLNCFHAISVSRVHHSQSIDNVVGIMTVSLTDGSRSYAMDARKDKSAAASYNVSTSDLLLF